jgi:hypothetical protein
MGREQAFQGRTSTAAGAGAGAAAASPDQPQAEELQALAVPQKGAGRGAQLDESAARMTGDRTIGRQSGRGGAGRKITPQQREALLALYLAHGHDAAAAHAATLGVGPNYARKLASERNYRPLYVATGSLRRGMAGAVR